MAEDYKLEGEIRTPRLWRVVDRKPALVSPWTLPLDLELSGGAHLSLSPWPEEAAASLNDGKVERCAFEVNLSASSIEEARAKAFELLEWHTNFTAFRLQQPVYWLLRHALGGRKGQRGALDGNATFQRAARMGLDFNRPLMDSIAVAPPDVSDKVHGAMRWYHKGVGSVYDLDRFIAFWVVFELLAPESAAEAAAFMRPRNCSCGDFHECPKCGTTTRYTPRGLGPKITAYLTEDLGLTPADARKLSEFRQLLHGAGRLTAEHARNAGGLARQAQRAASDGLKKVLKIAPDDPPCIDCTPGLLAYVDPVWHLIT